MTVWDTIYRNHQKGGEAWPTLSEGIDPLFQEFLKESNFKLKHALDIGCGTGKYLKLLQSAGFRVDGIDSSPTAVRMSQEALGQESKVVFANMFEFEIPKKTYDLILSISW